MQIVQILIDIPEDYYNAIKAIPDRQCDADMLIIKSGTPLPKGHGRLIDADELFDKIQFADFSSSDDVNTALFSIGNAPTIIEADVERSGEE